MGPTPDRGPGQGFHGDDGMGGTALRRKGGGWGAEDEAAVGAAEDVVVVAAGLAEADEVDGEAAAAGDGGVGAELLFRGLLLRGLLFHGAPPRIFGGGPGVGLWAKRRRTGADLLGVSPPARLTRGCGPPCMAVLAT